MVPFLGALNNVLSNDPSNIGLTDGDLFFLANNACQPNEQVPYKDYVLYHNTTGMAAQLGNTDVLAQIGLLIMSELVTFRKAVNKAMMEDKPNWRRLTCLRNAREKQQRMEEKQILALYKPAGKPKLAEAAAITGTVVDDIPKPAPLPDIAGPAKPTLTALNDEPKKQTPLHEITMPLNEKWKNRFRPDWPWFLKETQAIHLTLPQLRGIEAEIADEKVAGIKHPNDRLAYIPQADKYVDGFFTFTTQGCNKLPRCTYRSIAHLKPSILATIAEQDKNGWVQGLNVSG